MLQESLNYTVMTQKGKERRKKSKVEKTDQKRDLKPGGYTEQELNVRTIREALKVAGLSSIAWDESKNKQSVNIIIFTSFTPISVTCFKLSWT